MDGGNNLPLLQDHAIRAVDEVAVLQGGLIVGCLQTRVVVQVAAAQNETEAGGVVRGVGVAAADQVGLVTAQLEELDEHRVVGGEADVVATGVGVCNVHSDLWVIDVLVQG